MFTANEIKAYLYVLICRAGLAAGAMKEMNKEQIEREVLQEFRGAVENCTIPASLMGMDEALSLRSKNFTARSCSSSDLHDGESVWRKFGEIKKVISNVFTHVYNSKMPGGIPPSGFSTADVLERTRVAIYANKFKGKERPATWTPTEWLVFTTYGKPSAEPEALFIIT